MAIPDTAWLVLFAFTLSGGQLLFKRAAADITGLAIPAIPAALAISPSWWGAITLYGTATFLWVWILTRVPLTQAYPWAALGAVFVPLAAVVILGEAVTPIYWLGAGLIATGIVLTQIGASSP